MPLIRIGIDPGKRTGLAAYSVAQRKLILCETDSIIGAMETIKDLQADDSISIHVTLEDARKRGGKPNSKIYQGVGSVKRDCSVWEEFLKYHQIPYLKVAPSRGKTKLNKEVFARLSGWRGRTSGHARDAGMLVIGG